MGSFTSLPSALYPLGPMTVGARVLVTGEIGKTEACATPVRTTTTLLCCVMLFATPLHPKRFARYFAAFVNCCKVVLGISAVTHASSSSRQAKR